MAMTNHERVGKALEFLKSGRGPFVGREVKSAIATNSLTPERVRGEKRKAGGSLIKAAPGSLKPWREIVTPHADAASGRYQQAEFAADL
ncbi:hypothetical protein [Tepidimonas sp.]|uniref:hypothetical protein n=1 Tax=Tepidimonas sp. TaxID=2002775 RepID=UPI0028D2C0A9|nr:hypothetical protein [Tepidimonas sp.]